MFRSAATTCAGSPRHCCLFATLTQFTLQQIFSPACDPDLADPPTPLAAGAGDAAALQRG
jgi:hypothetical protein